MPQPLFLPVELFRETLLFGQVEHLVDDFAEVWSSCSIQEFRLEKIFTAEQQEKRERRLIEFIHNLQSEQKNNSNAYDDVEVQERIFSHVRMFFSSALDFSKSQLDVLLALGFKDSTKVFVQLARQFDPTLKPADLFQACRNVWIMNGVQLMLGLEVKFTPSIFAYSMLYPYTDNYLDDASISKADKIEFNNRFAHRLAGVRVSPQNSHEDIIFSLVDMIEGDFDRREFPQVFESLLAIHQAQTKSVALLGKTDVSTDDVLRISLEKGGTSVLADGFLVAGRLTDEQARWLFGYGAYLQFLDDVQDIHEDSERLQATVFTRCNSAGDLQAETNRSFHFGHSILRAAPGFLAVATPTYLRIMRSCIPLMLIEAVGFAPDSFSAPYLNYLQQFSPFRFQKLHQIKAQHQPYYVSMFGKMI